MFKSFFLFTTLISAFAGCGSGSSTAHNDTGSIAAKLTWNSSGAKTAAKTLYAAPAGVTLIKITVSGVGISTNIVKDFIATPGSDGSGTIDGIPAGTGRTITAWGLDDSRIIRYQGTVTGITVVAGTVTNAGVVTMTAPATTALPAGGSFSYPLTVSLTASEPATIYYTTNGQEPTTSSANGPSPFDIQILAPTTLRFFAINSGFAQEVTKTEIYN